MDTQTGDLFTSDGGGADAAPIEQHASHAYLGYAVSTVKSRALPEIADGLKPVQRRILYAMGDTPGGGQSYSKCARYVGEDNKGQKFVIVADRAVQPTSNVPIVAIEGMRAQLNLGKGPLSIAALKGRYVGLCW